MVNHPSQQSKSVLDSIKHIRATSDKYLVMKSSQLTQSKPALDASKRRSWISIQEIKKIVDSNPQPLSGRSSVLDRMQSDRDEAPTPSSELGTQQMYTSLSLKYIREQVSGENIRKQQPIFFNEKGAMIQTGKAGSKAKALPDGQKIRRNPTLDHQPSTNFNMLD